MENQDCVEVWGLGTVREMTTMNQGNINVTLENVLYAPSMLRNSLLSSEARKIGYKTVLENDNQSNSGESLKMTNEQSGSID